MGDLPGSELYGPPAPGATEPTKVSQAAFWVTPIYSQSGALISPTGPTFIKDSPWDIVLFNGLPLPGICSVKCQPTIKIDVKKSPGRDGATLTPQGYLPGPIEISTVLWTPPQWAEYEALLSMIWPRHKGPTAQAVALAQSRNKTKNPTTTQLADAQLYVDALVVTHPTFQAYKIYSVVVTGVSAPEPGPVVQSKIVRIRCIEYQEPGRVAPTKVRQKSKAVADAPGVPTLQSPAAPSKSGNGLAGPPAATIGGT